MRLLLTAALALITSAATAANVTLVPQGLYVERADDGTLDCTATNGIRLELQMISMELQDLGTTQMERSESGIVRFDDGAGAFMEVNLEQAIVALTPMTRTIALQGEHVAGGLFHLNAAVLENGDLDVKSARHLEGQSDLTTYIMPVGQPPEGQRPNGTDVTPLGYCQGSTF